MSILHGCYDGKMGILNGNVMWVGNENKKM